jgi:hypothetical protein
LNAAAALLNDAKTARPADRPALAAFDGVGYSSAVPAPAGDALRIE